MGVGFNLNASSIVAVADNICVCRLHLNNRKVFHFPKQEFESAELVLNIFEYNCKWDDVYDVNR